MMEAKKMLVQWRDYSHTIQSAMQNFRLDEELLDCTLACDGFTVRAHKLVLAASSQYFRQVFKDYPCSHPTIIIDGIGIQELLDVVQFMYSGNVLVNQEEVVPLLSAAATLAVDGLSIINASMFKTSSDSQASSGYEGSPLALNEEQLQDNKTSTLNEYKSGEVDDDKLREPNANSVKSPTAITPALKRIRTASENSTVEEDLSKKVVNDVNCSQYPLLPQIIEDNVRNESKSESTINRNSDKYDVNYKSPVIPLVLSQYLNGNAANEETIESNPYKDKVNSPDNGDLDCGPPPLPPNHPAVIAASLSAVANGSPMGLGVAAILAAQARSQLLPQGSNSDNSLPVGIANASTLPTWPSNDRSSPIPQYTGQEYVQSIGHSVQDVQATLEQYQRKLAFHEPRPCPTCKRMYRDAATLRTHLNIMHIPGKEPFACNCGLLFRTKYDMYQHKKNGHR